MHHFFGKFVRKPAAAFLGAALTARGMANTLYYEDRVGVKEITDHDYDTDYEGNMGGKRGRENDQGGRKNKRGRGASPLVFQVTDVTGSWKGRPGIEGSKGDRFASPLVRPAAQMRSSHTARGRPPPNFTIPRLKDLRWSLTGLSGNAFRIHMPIPLLLAVISSALVPNLKSCAPSRPDFAQTPRNSMLRRS